MGYEHKRKRRTTRRQNRCSRLHHSYREWSYAAIYKWPLKFARHQFGLQWHRTTIRLACDHLPILITINSELLTIDGPRRTYINFKKADWARYAEACDEYLAEAVEKRTVEQAVKTLRKTVNKASGLFIPASRFQPTLPASAKSLADERDRKRGLSLADE